MAAEFKKARAEVKALKDQQSAEIQSLGKLGSGLKKAGYNTSNFKEGQRALKSSIGKTSNELEKQRRELKRVSDHYKKAQAAKARYREATQSAANMGIIGAAGVAVGTRTIKGSFDIVQSVRPLEAAIGELQSLGIENLQVYRDQAAKTDAQLAYTTADSFVRAAYDIRSGMSGLTDEGVAAMTDYALVTARATKAAPEQMTSLTATAYGIFRNQYSQLSDIEWGEQFTSGLAASVRAYKTNGEQMQRAIESARGGAALLGMDMREEFAILGTLQASMKGAEAGTALKSYTANAAKAHASFESNGIDIKILNSDGMLRETQKVMEDIRAHYGTLDAIEMAEIKKAFGTDEAATLINGLIDNTASFNTGFNQISTGMREGRKYLDDMAALMDANGDAQFQQGLEDWQMMKLDLGYALLPVFTAMIPAFKKITTGISNFSKEHKGLVGIIGMAIIMFGAMAAIMGGVTLAMASMMGPLAMLKFGKFMLGGQSLGLMKILRPLGLVFKALARIAIPLMITAVRSLGIAIMSTPIGWIIGGLALVGVAAYLLAKKFGGVRNVLAKGWAGLKTVFAWSPIGLIARAMMPAFKFLKLIVLSPVTAAREAWAMLRSILSWKPGAAMGAAWGGFKQGLSAILLSPVIAGRAAWNSLKSILSWRPSWAGNVAPAMDGLKLILLSPVYAARAAWNALKSILAWRPSWAGNVAPVMDGLKLILLSPVYAARAAWNSLKSILAWRPSLAGNVAPAMDSLKLILLSPVTAARDAWAMLRSILSWKPGAAMGAAWGGFKQGFKTMFGDLKDTAGDSLDFIHKKIAAIMGAPRRLWGKMKGIGKAAREKVGLAGAPIRAAANAGIRTAAIGASIAAAPALAAPSILLPKMDAAPAMIPGPSVTGANYNAGTTIEGDRYEIHVHAAAGMNEDDLIEKLEKLMDKRDRMKQRKTGFSLSDIEE